MAARTLDQEWADGPHTYLGISVVGFPNLFTITGPQSPSVLANMPVAIAQHVEWITDCIDTLRRTGKTVIEATEQAQEEWRAQVNEVVSKTLFTRANSWYMGANIPGKPRTFLPYLDPAGSAATARSAMRLRRRDTQGSRSRSPPDHPRR